ncbi:MAG: hypothetical protein Q9227_004954 [Pyrenula ochraceoflavens]
MSLPPTPTWLITGCSSGLGLSLAQTVLSRGHNVIASSRNPSKTPEAVKSITSHANGRWIALDVTASPVELASKAKEAESLFGGRIDVLVNNAGYSILGALEDIPPEAARAQMDTNFFGPLALTNVVLPGMRARGTGVIVNVSSVAGQCPLPSSGLYAASKFALEAISESFAAEVAPFGVKVLIVEPGAFRTQFLASTNANFVESSEAYKEGPVGVTVGKYRSMDGKQGGDPEKACRYIVEAVMGEGEFAGGKEVQRLMLGADCRARVKAKVESLQRDMETCAVLQTDV